MIEGLADGVERALAPIDAARRLGYRATVPWFGSWVVDRDRRVMVLAALIGTTALAGAVLAPLPMLALGPIVLGVPHLLADVRYLVVQPGIHRRGPAVLLVGALLLGTAIFGTLAPGIAGAVLATLLLARASLVRRVLVAVPLVVLLVASVAAPRVVDLGFAHGHNLVAVGLWLAAASAYGRTSASTRWVIAAGLVGLAVPIALGATDGLLRSTVALSVPGGPGLTGLQRALAPFDDPTLALRGVALFAYGQAIHYGLWLRLIPEDTRARPAPRSFATSWRVLREELGGPLLLLTLLGCVGLVGWAVADLAAARGGYLRLALFHGPLELVAAGLLLAEGRRFFRPDADAS